jgi:hypothetical protein
MSASKTPCTASGYWPRFRRFTTPSLEQLAAMQREVDDILRETIHCHRDGAIEDGDVSAFGLVLVQLHQTAAERRRS